MIQKKIALLFFTAGIAVIIIQAFSFPADSEFAKQIEQSNCGITKISKPNGKESHFFGLNCMSCHTDGRKGAGCFTVAGSVLDEDRSFVHKNPVIKLYSRPKATGNLVATIYGDGLGNFYTTQKIDFSSGLYATLIGSPGVAEPVKHMTRRLIPGMGRCNQCHGHTEEALGID